METTYNNVILMTRLLIDEISLKMQSLLIETTEKLTTSIFCHFEKSHILKKDDSSFLECSPNTYYTLEHNLLAYKCAQVLIYLELVQNLSAHNRGNWKF